MFTFAGQFTEAILATGSSGATLLPALTAHVYTVGTTTHVTLYTSRTKGSTTGNPVTTDVNGNLTFFVDPGQYDVVFTPPGGSQKRVNISVPQDPLEDPGTYVAKIAAPTGVAATDAAAIQAAHDALTAGGELRLQAGTYALGTIGVTFTKPVRLTGAGGSSITNYTSAATQLTYTSSTGTAITAGAGFSCDRFLLKYTGGTTPTAGAGISATGDLVKIEADVAGFWNNVMVNGALARVDGNNYAPVNYGLDIGNDLAPDSGDHIVSGWITAATQNSAAGIHYRSGGGLKCTALKINTGGGGKFNFGLDMELEATTSDLLIDSSCSIENTRSHSVNLRQKGATAAVFPNIQIYAQIAPYTAGVSAVNIAPANGTRPFTNIKVGGVLLGASGAPAVALSNVDTAIIDPVASGWTATYTQTSSTNVRPQLAEQVWIPAQQLAISDNFGGTITRGPEARWDAISMGAAGTMVLAATLAPFPGWQTYAVDLYWVNAGAGTGAVVWRHDYQQIAAGGTLSAAGTGATSVAATAAAQDVLTVTTLTAGIAFTANDVLSLRVLRLGDDAGDTLANAAAVIGVMVRRVN